MPTENKADGQQGEVTEVVIKKISEEVVKKFGERYKDEVPVTVGEYDFYIDMFQFGEDLSRQLNEQGSGWTVESRKRFLELEKESLLPLAEMLGRYNVPQEMIKGVGIVGSMLYMELSQGEKNGKVLGKKIFVSKYRNKVNLTADKSTTEFGIPCISEGMEFHIPVFEENVRVVDSKEIGEKAIGDIPARLRFMVQEMWRGGSLENIDKEMLVAEKIFQITEGDSKSKAEEVLACMLGKLGVVDYDCQTVEKSELDRDAERQFRNTFFNSLRSLLIDEGRSAYLSHEKKRKVGFEDGVYGRVEKALLNGDKILILPSEGLSFLPAVYFAMQIVADRYKIDGQDKATDLDMATYWRSVVFDVNEVGSTNSGVLFMVQNLYEDRWDNESGFKSEIRTIMDKLELGGEFSVAEMSTENVLENRLGDWVVVSHRGSDGKIKED